MNKKVIAICLFVVLCFVFTACSSSSEPEDYDYQKAQVILYDNGSMGNMWKYDRDESLDIVSETGGYEEGVDGGGGYIIFTITPTKNGKFPIHFYWEHVDGNIEATADYTMCVEEGVITAQDFSYDGDYPLKKMYRVVK